MKRRNNARCAAILGFIGYGASLAIIAVWLDPYGSVSHEWFRIIDLSLNAMFDIRSRHNLDHAYILKFHEPLMLMFHVSIVVGAYAAAKFSYSFIAAVRFGSFLAGIFVALHLLSDQFGSHDTSGLFTLGTMSTFDALRSIASALTFSGIGGSIWYLISRAESNELNL